MEKEVLGPENSNKKGWVVWIVWGLSTLAFLILCFWILFYSASFANLSFIVPVRIWYQDTFPNFKTNYSIQVRKPLSLSTSDFPFTYTYTLVGTFKKIDAKNDIIYIEGPDKKTYSFLTGNMEFQGPQKDTWLKVAQTLNLKTFSNGIVLTPSVKPPLPNDAFITYRQILIQNDILTANVTAIGARWNDKRTLSQILTDYSKNKDLPLNNDVPESLVLAEFK